jgi:hypothetical protein
MSTLRRLVVAIGAWLLCCSAGAAALELVDSCAGSATEDARGVVALESQCPGLEAALREMGVVESLPEGWRDALDRRALGDLASLTHRYRDLPAQAAPDPGKEQVKPARSWWDAVKQWLRSQLGQPDDASTPWLKRLLDRIGESAGLIRTITYVLLVLVVIAAVAFVVNELRVAGVLSRRRGSARAGEVTAALPGVAVAPDIADLDAAALRDQPGILMRLLVARLLINGQLQAERNLTHRELVKHSAFADPENRLRFARVTQLAERVLYGAGEADAAQSRAAIADGRGLLLQLQAVAGEQP